MSEIGTPRNAELEESDTDGDGIPDLDDWDFDNDGIPDYLDLDADDDGIPNEEDEGPSMQTAKN